MPEIVNIAAYKFATLTDLPPLREELKSLADALSLRGTILLSGEGINLFLAGTRNNIDAMLRRLRHIPASTRSRRRRASATTSPSTACW